MSFQKSVATSAAALFSLARYLRARGHQRCAGAQPWHSNALLNRVASFDPRSVPALERCCALAHPACNNEG